ncbi:DUF2586 domain-containing protein [Lentisphaerota bacterium WC36G]|nr:DUF2586 domain-containing protein [Lentisphaerae bacterium WC36]
MSVGSVTVSQVNNMQGEFKQLERTFLYVGKSDSDKNKDKILTITAQSDLDDLLGSGDSDLKTNLKEAIVNSRDDNFFAYALPIASDATWKEKALEALDKPNDLNVEAVVVITPITKKDDATSAQFFAYAVMSKYAKFVTVMLCCEGIKIDSATEADNETWSDYTARVKGLIVDVAADRVAVVPQLHGNNLGVVCGRLNDCGVSIADTPMRVKTGALIGLGPNPVDKDSVELNMGHLKDLSDQRFSVPQYYNGYDGWYWADHHLLDVEAGDFLVYENRRILDYLARRVRIIAIGKIGDRALNNTSKSIAVNKIDFARPLREASKGFEIAGKEFPGMIKPPEENAIDIVWQSRTEVNIAITATPFECPKSIKLWLALDLNTIQ